MGVGKESMNDHMHYVPILRWKAGEKSALKGLYQNDKAGVTPLIEWSRPGEVSPQEDRETPTPSPSDLVLDILKHWGPRLIFLRSSLVFRRQLVWRLEGSTELRTGVGDYGNQSNPGNQSG